MSGDTVESLRALRDRKEWSFGIYHAGAETLRAFGALKRERGLHGTPLAIPLFLVADKHGVIRWAEVKDALFRRIGPAALLKALDGLTNSKPPTPDP